MPSLPALPLGQSAPDRAAASSGGGRLDPPSDGKSLVGCANYTSGINNPQGLPVSGTFNGSFYGPSAANTGGNFSFHTTVGPTYLTSGIFAAAKH